MKKLNYKKSVAAALGFALLGGSAVSVQAAGDSEFIGSISYVGFNFAPRAYAKCDGQLLAISSNAALFSLLGTTFGGDGRNTFGLPDMRGRVPIHQGQGPGLASYRIGQRGGNERTTLSLLNLPSHGHTLAATSVSTSVLMGVNAKGNEPKPKGNSVSRPTATGNNFSSTAPTATMSTGSVVTTTTTTGTTTDTGAGLSFSNLQPFTTLNCVIAMNGLYPPRN
jgi:microcystin-dependent protein